MNSPNSRVVIDKLGNKLTIDIIGHVLKDVSIRTPNISFDESTGEIQASYHTSEGSEQFIQSIKLLYYAYFDEKGSCVNYEPIVSANNYLLHLKINKGLKDTNSHSNSFIHYYSLLLDWNMDWHDFPIRTSLRPTYRFKNFLELAATSQNSKLILSSSTAINYMSAVKNLYIHYISKGVKFSNPPMEYDHLVHYMQNKENSMAPYRKLFIQSTDLRLKIPRKNHEEQARPLMALNSNEWDMANNVLKSKKVIKNFGGGEFKYVSIPYEYILMCYIMRYVGLRREEVSTLRTSHITLPNVRQNQSQVVEVLIGPSSGVNTKGGSERSVSFPSKLMKVIYNYLQTNNHHKRRDKGLQKDSYAKHVFLSNQGKQYSLSTLTSRWTEIRNTIRHIYKVDFYHKQHNLRSTFAVNTLTALLNAGFKQGDALNQLQKLMGHLDSDTTESYLMQSNNQSSSHEISEQVLDFLFDLDELTFT
jgi:integrase